MAPRPPAEPDPCTPVFSTADEDGYERHFHEQGFVVVGGVLDGERVEATVRELWEHPSLLGGHPGLKREDPSTWGSDTWPAGSRNFLDPLNPCSEIESWSNRVHPAVCRVFDVLWRGLRTHSEVHDVKGGQLVVSVDRFGVMRPTRIRVSVQQEDGTSEEVAAERPEWRTSRNWLHWDQNPWSTPGFDAMQGLLALSEGTATSGGFVTVPGFHKDFARWGKEHPEGSVLRATASTVPFAVPPEDELQDRRVKVLVPRGGLLVWDSRLPHENFPNGDEAWRVVQYVTCKRLSVEALGRRAGAWRAVIRTGLVAASFVYRFSAVEQARLGMAAMGEHVRPLLEALQECEELPPEALEAAATLRRAWRLQQTAATPAELQEVSQLFRKAFSVNPRLAEPLQCVGAAEASYLPFWIF